jgi:hypothetical protein
VSSSDEAENTSRPRREDRGVPRSPTCLRGRGDAEERRWAEGVIGEEGRGWDDEVVGPGAGAVDVWSSGLERREMGGGLR